MWRRGGITGNNIHSANAQFPTIAIAAAAEPHIRSISITVWPRPAFGTATRAEHGDPCNGYLTHEETSQIQNRPWIQPEKLLGIPGQKAGPRAEKHGGRVRELLSAALSGRGYSRQKKRDCITVV